MDPSMATLDFSAPSVPVILSHNSFDFLASE